MPSCNRLGVCYIIKAFKILNMRIRLGKDFDT